MIVVLDLVLVCCLFALSLVTLRFLWPPFVSIPARCLANVDVARAMFQRPDDRKHHRKRLLVGLVERMLRGTTSDPVGRMFELRQALSWIGKGSDSSAERMLREGLIGRLYPKVIYEMLDLVEEELVGISPDFAYQPPSIMADRVFLVVALMTRGEEIRAIARSRPDLDDAKRAELVDALTEAERRLAAITAGELCSVRSAVQAFEGRPPSIEQAGELLAVVLSLANARRRAPARRES